MARRVQLPINALARKVGFGTRLIGYPTNQALAILESDKDVASARDLIGSLGGSKLQLRAT
jgi:hypothetical protein